MNVRRPANSRGTHVTRLQSHLIKHNGSSKRCTAANAARENVADGDEKRVTAFWTATAADLTRPKMRKVIFIHGCKKDEERSVTDANFTLLCES